VIRLKPFERKLRGTLARNGENTDALVDLVAVNRKVIEEVQVSQSTQLRRDLHPLFHHLLLIIFYLEIFKSRHSPRNSVDNFG